jgi:trk system potassium uptake protein TrkA
VRVIIIGAGKIGRHLARELAEAGHAVTVAESDAEVARRLAESVDALVLEGDGTNMSVLKDAEVSRTDCQLISRELDIRHLERIALLARGRISLIEIEVSPSAPTRLVAELGLPAQTVLVAAIREGAAEEVVVPRGDTMIKPGDRVLVVTTVENESAVRAALSRRAAAQDDEH